MLTAHPLETFETIDAEERGALAVLGCTTNLDVVAFGPNEEARYALARRTGLSLHRVEQLMAVLALAALPDVTEGEARLLAWLGVPSIGRLAELSGPELLRRQEAAHAPTMTRLGLSPLSAERAEALVTLARNNPRFPRMVADRNALAGRRWLDRPAAWLELQQLLRADDPAVALRVAGEIRAEATAASVYALARVHAPTPGQAAARASLVGGSWSAATAALRVEDSDAVKALRRRRRALPIEDDAQAAVALDFLLTVDFSRAARDAEGALVVAREQARSWRYALRRRNPGRLADRVRDAVPVLEGLAVSLLAWPEIALAAWQITQAVGGDPEGLGRARARWLDAWTEAAATVGAMLTLAPLLTADALSPDTAGAKARRHLARYSRSTTEPLLRSDWAPVAAGEPAERLTLSGDVKALPLEGRLVLYSHDGRHRAFLTGDGLSIDTLPAFALTPAVATGRWEPATETLTLGDGAALGSTWEAALLAEADRFAPRLADRLTLFPARNMPAALLVLSLAPEVHDE
ncbi:MAG: DUF4332 domain-containing protein [Alphaproteobacteria bacterium]|nr:DUF4332 domain-containing protein [Alphaproteobacteria bacterium]